MKLAVASQIRNEIDIVGTFLQHLDALFDYAVLMDHGSIDGTDRMIAAACARRDGWTMWRVETVSWHQHLLADLAIRHLMRHTDTDCLLLLDADEFINVPDRGALEATLSVLTDPDRIGRLVWRNAVPTQFQSRTIMRGEPIWLPPTGAHLGKLAITRLFYTRHWHEAHISLGNHALFYHPQHAVPTVPVGDIVHLPIRSYAQLKNKLLAGIFALMTQAQQNPGESWHWHSMLERIGDGTLRDEDLIGMIVHYSEQNKQTLPESWGNLENDGYTQSRLNIAFGRALASIPDAQVADPVQLIATILRRFRVDDPTTHSLVVRDNRVRFIPKGSTT